ncbi:hypothetical protein B566_EDAN001332 [Ephemera danica]|nr:hypothetical protein B566_EDAN001332 [Ephemera danica]
MEPVEHGERTLGELFDEGYKGLLAINKSKEPMRSNEVQVQVRRAISALEDCTRLVSAAGMFSTNEKLDEVSSQNIRYLLLPALLGRLTQHISLPDLSGRLEVAQLADTYFRDFLTRCREYGVTDNPEVARLLDEEPYTPEMHRADMAKRKAMAKEQKEQPKKPPEQSTQMVDLQAMANKRFIKIRNFIALTEMEKRRDELKEIVEKGGADDEVIREYHILLVDLNVAQAVEELDSLELEKRILTHQAKIVRENKMFAEDEVPEGQRPPSRKQPRKPLNPVIITRDQAMKEVFGAGYPSLPVMTVAEFYDQRFPWWLFFVRLSCWSQPRWWSPGYCSSN